MALRRAAVLLQAERAGLEQACAAAQAVRHMGAPASGHEPSPTTPLSAVMPGVVALPRQVVGTALGLVQKAVIGAATSGYAKGLVTSFAEKAIVDEAIVKVEDVDVPFWAYWLSASGYTSHAGFKKFAEAAKLKVAALAPQQVVDLTVAFQRASYYDKDLFAGIAANVSANFTKYDTEGLLKVLSAFLEFGFYEQAAFDDIADSITYCNHYLAPLRAPVAELSAAFAAYAKAGHERGDLFAALARGISESALSALPAAERKAVVMQTLRAFHAFQFWPESADALFHAAKSGADAFSADELKEVEKYQTIVEDAVGGELKVFKEGDDVDAVHWYGHMTPAPSSYNLYVFRDSLVPKAYSPASIRPLKA